MDQPSSVANKGKSVMESKQCNNQFLPTLFNADDYSILKEGFDALYKQKRQLLLKANSFVEHVESLLFLA